jgi:hypothetical protein
MRLGMKAEAAEKQERRLLGAKTKAAARRRAFLRREDKIRPMNPKGDHRQGRSRRRCMKAHAPGQIIFLRLQNSHGGGLNRTRGADQGIPRHHRRHRQIRQHTHGILR